MRYAAPLLALLLAACASGPETAAQPGSQQSTWTPTLASQPVSDDPGDPAIWMHPTDPAMSVVVATNRAAAPDGALVVFDLDGQILQTIAGLDLPNDVDLRGNLIAVTERNKSALRLFAIDPATRKVSDAASAPVFTGENSDSAAPMGIALYKRPGDGAVFAIVGRKSGPAEGYLWQYRVADGAAPALTLVRKFGKFSGTGEITSIVVDDERGYVYYADERSGIRKYYADPDHADAATELAHFGTTGYTGDRKGLAIAGNYLISTDQVRGESHYLLYWRDGTTTNPHDHSAMVESYAGADATEGIEATLTPLGPRFPQGMLVTMNRTPKNFLYWAWPPPRLQP